MSILCIGRIVYAICQIDEVTPMKETWKMFRTFIQCAAFLQAVISAVLLIKGGISISVKDMAELSQTKWDFSLAVLKNLVRQKADTIVGFSLLMLSVIFQSLHWLLPFGIDDLGINRIGVIIAFIFATAMWFVASRLSIYLGQKWYTQAENILKEKPEVAKNNITKQDS
jgi:hypothetical protein